jgi:hypothetical protein
MEIGTEVKMKINKDEDVNRIYVLGIKKDKRVGNTKYNRTVHLDIEGRTEEVGVVVNRFNQYDKEFVTIQFLQDMDRKYGLEFMLDGELGEWVLNPYKIQYYNPNGTLIEYDKNEKVKDYENLIKRHTNQIDNLQMDIDSWLEEIEKIDKEMN